MYCVFLFVYKEKYIFVLRITRYAIRSKMTVSRHPLTRFRHSPVGNLTSPKVRAKIALKQEG